MQDKILFVNNGAGLSDVKSGGTARHIETARVIKRYSNIYSLTTIGGFKNYKNEKLDFESFFVVWSHIYKKQESGNFDRLFGYFISTIHSVFAIILRRIEKCDLVYSTSDYFCDVIPALLYSKIYKAKFVCMVHHRCKSPFNRKGNFVINSLSYIFQKFSFFIIRHFADALFVYKTEEGEKIANIIKAKKTYRVKNGIPLEEISKVSVKEKIYDVSFAGGLRETKGIYDLIPILEEVKEQNEDVVVGVAGGGTKEVTKDFMARLDDADLSKNMKLLGPLPQKQLYKAIKSSKLFLSTSHEEGWGISVLEAVALGIPVIAFDLPAFKYLKNNILRVEMYNHKSAARQIIKLLKNKSYLENYHNRTKEFVKEYDWNHIGEEDYKYLKKVLK